MKKTIVSAILGTGMVLAAAFPAFAAINCTNDTTGPLSSNYCNLLAKKKAKLSLNNTGTVSNNVTTNSSSGNNVQQYNTNGGTDGILTSNATATANPIETLLNTNDVTLTQPCDDCAAGTAGNSITGPSSTNNATVDISKRIKVRISNVGTVVNEVNTNANTGGNVSQFNTIAGGIFTGEANSSTGVSTILNSNVVNITQ